jgi:peptidoglycan/LPS O-acetylase OafA/YrhL
LEVPVSNYRADIDGLRAFSVLAVIGFHLNSALPGGYIGVDVFFVISGFLIGRMVLDEISSGSFSFTAFYQRRARRILPSLLFTLFWTFAVASILLTPRDMVAFAKSAMASLLFAANVFFYQSNEYFAQQASELPLLHLWSLGVEEQFYIGFPVLALILARLYWRWLVIALAALGLGSVAWSQIELSSKPEAAFYLIHSRMFELIIGILLSQLRAFILTPVTAERVAWSGAALLFATLFLFNDQTPFPGLLALLPCAAAAAIIWSGHAGTRLSRLLSQPVMVYIGKLSYPLYLAHWPVIVFAKMAFPAKSDAWLMAPSVATSILLAVISYHLIERPIRFGRWRSGLAYVAAAAVLFVLGPISALATAGFEGRYRQAARDILDLKGQDPLASFRHKECFLDPEQSYADFAMQKCLSYHRPMALLWGDSHAAHHFAGLNREIEAAGYSLSQLTASACPPILGYVVKERPYCRDINDRIVALIEARKPSIVILSSFWKVFHPDLLKQTLIRISASAGTVVVLGNTPIFAEPVPRFLAREDKSVPIRMSDRSETERKMSEMFAQGLPGNVKYVPLMELSCPKGVCVLAGEDEAPYYFDEGHLTQQGSSWLARQIVPLVIERKRGS